MSKSTHTTAPFASDLQPQNTNKHHQHPIKYINIQHDSPTQPATTNNNKVTNNPNPSTSRFVSKVNNIYKSITTTSIRNNIDNESTTSSITLPSLQKRKVKKDKIEEFINKILSRDINSNEQFPPLNKTINNNFSDNISDELVLY